MTALFEGTYLGDDAKLEDGARLECGICWHVYDPAVGDPVWQVTPGTPFSALPAHWRCPNCDAPKHKFMLLGAALSAGPRRNRRDDRVEALLAAYRAAEVRLRGLPVHNPALAVEALPFRAFDDGLMGLVITPWFMNLTLIPAEPGGWADLLPGETVAQGLPSGSYDFLVGELEGFGRVLTCSLFSPMDEFPDPGVARLTAQAALEEAMRRPAPAPMAQHPRSAGARDLSRPVGRRSLFALSDGHAAASGPTAGA